MTDGSPPLLRKLALELRPDPRRTVIRPFLPTDPPGFGAGGEDRPARIARRVLAFNDAAVQRQQNRISQSLGQGAPGAEATLLQRGGELLSRMGEVGPVDEERRLLLGAYFSAEYSFEAAALFNPSIVAYSADDTVGGDTHFVLSLRGIGEGHLSSVTFRTGVWRANGEVVIDAPAETGVPPVVEGTDPQAGGTTRIDCRGSREPSEAVLFPITESQGRGIEDLRLTPFLLPDGSRTFLGTYTAVGSAAIRQEALRTDDFRTFDMYPVQGDLAPAKGMALFPRQVGGRYLALGRQDNENLWLAHSDDLITWAGGERLLEPAYPWEAVQIGNCGVADRDRRGVAGADAWCRRGAKLLHWRRAARSRRPVPRARSPFGTAAGAG